ncbi:MAG: hypothetical protein ACRDF7_03180 [Candidatus Limnocylindrales bacterium]
MLELIAAVAILLIVNVAAVVSGTDSRESMPDDHRRGLGEGI